MFEYRTVIAHNDPLSWFMNKTNLQNLFFIYYQTEKNKEKSWSLLYILFMNKTNLQSLFFIYYQAEKNKQKS